MVFICKFFMFFWGKIEKIFVPLQAIRLWRTKTKRPAGYENDGNNYNENEN